MSRAVCPECEQGKCPNCTGEAMQGETLVDCGCLGRTHLSGMEQEVYLMIEGLAHLGATVPEIMRAKGIKRPAAPLGVLLNRGYVVNRGDARDGWRVYVAHRVPVGPQIDAQSVDDKQEGTDMTDEKGERGSDPIEQLIAEGKGEPLGDGESTWSEVPPDPSLIDYKSVMIQIPGRPAVLLRFDDEVIATVETEVAKVMQPRLSALAGAKSILGEETTPSGIGGRQGKTRPSVDDLLRLAVYIDKGVVLGADLIRKASTDA